MGHRIRGSLPRRCVDTGELKQGSVEVWSSTNGGLDGLTLRLHDRTEVQIPRNLLEDLVSEAIRSNQIERWEQMDPAEILVAAGVNAPTSPYAKEVAE